MNFEILSPGPQLMESMRAVGYSLETALADIVDNSITAEATHIDIRFNTEPGQTYVSISDNGYGMDAAGVRHAMKLAGHDAQNNRNAQDLGRFGLGLKTASFSQCRKLTLFSKKDNQVVGVQWDLDRLVETGQWQLRILSQKELTGYTQAEALANQEAGTVVLWENIDVSDPEHDKFAADFTAKMASAKNHLALIYHRYLEGEDGRKLTIRLNLDVIKPVDPFLRQNRGHQPGHRETIRVAGEEITLRPFTLPFINKMTAEEREQVQLTGSLRDSQGFYIYRAKRLVIWGTWFRLVPRSELGRLARVQVDIPNTLDHLWALDIKKSAASPPPAIRQALRQVVDRILQPSERAFRHKGIVENPKQRLTRTWLGMSSRDGFHYEINREHPLLQNLTDQLNSAQLRSLETALKAIESSFPAADAYLKMAGDQPLRSPETGEATLKELAREYWQQWSESGGTAIDFVNGFIAAEQFAQSRDARALLTEVTEMERENVNY